jgi:ADP-ribose pyrophosphatase
MVQDKWAQLSTRVIFSSPYYRLSHDRYRLPSGGVGEYTYIDIAGSTMAIPVLDDERLVLVRQYRYLHGRESLEFPAGGLKAEKTALENMQAELIEEAGYEANRWAPLGEFAPCNGASNEICQLFVARDLRSVPSRPEESEELSLVTLTEEQVAQAIIDAEIWDGMTIVAFHFYRARARPR